MLGLGITKIMNRNKNRQLLGPVILDAFIPGLRGSLYNTCTSTCMYTENGGKRAAETSIWPLELEWLIFVE